MNFCQSRYRQDSRCGHSNNRSEHRQTGLSSSILARGSLSIVALSLATATASWAGTIPYPNPGTIAPEIPVFASGNNGVSVYYFGSSAAFTDYVEVYDLSTKFDSGEILGNHSTSLGAESTVGAKPGEINAGDQLLFYIDSPEGKFASLAAYSADGVNHAYITSYAGGELNGLKIPAGLYVGLEDEINGASDFNYADDPFVFAGVSAPSVPTAATPEPSTLALLGTGFLGGAQAIRRRLQR